MAYFITATSLNIFKTLKRVTQPGRHHLGKSATGKMGSVVNIWVNSMQGKILNVTVL